MLGTLKITIAKNCSLKALVMPFCKILISKCFDEKQLKNQHD
jgi:hypothetical protein